MTSFSRGLGCQVGLAAGLFRAPLHQVSAPVSPSIFSVFSVFSICSTNSKSVSRAPVRTYGRAFSTSAPVRAKRPKPYPRAEFTNGKVNIPSRIVMPSKPAKPAPAQPAQASPVAAAHPPRAQPPRAQPVPARAPRAVPKSTFAEQLGLRSAPTLLYEAPSHTWYRFITTSLGITFVSYSVLNYWDVYLNAPKDILWWVPYAFAGICAFMAAFGAYMFRGTHGIIRSIQAVPAARVEQLCGKKAAAVLKGKSGSGDAPIVLELKIERMLPVLPPRRRYVLPGSLVLPARLASAGLSESATGAFGARPASPATSLNLKERVLSRRAEEERRRAAREYEMDHLMTAPFRHAGQGASTAWKHVLRAFSHEGFMRVTEQGSGKRHKMDITGGWALDNGRALDRLVSVFDDE